MKNFHERLIVKSAAAPLVFLYKSVNLVKRALYKRGILRAYKVNTPVISIGNTVMGGGGKTPMTAWLAEELSKKKKCVIISRGYGRENENEIVIIKPEKNRKPDPLSVGDEPAMLARQLPEIPIICCADRAGAVKTAERLFKPDFIIMDDGFQHMKLERDYDILVVPPRPSFWKREFDSAYRNANAVIQTGEYIPKRLPKGVPVIRAERRLGDPVNIYSGKQLKLKTLKGAEITAVAGIADPDSFFSALEINGIIITRRFRFPDHHKYSSSDTAEIEGHSSGAKYILTTAKDAVRIEKQSYNRAEWYYIPLHLNISEPKKLLSILNLK